MIALRQLIALELRFRCCSRPPLDFSCANRSSVALSGLCSIQEQARSNDAKLAWSAEGDGRQQPLGRSCFGCLALSDTTAGATELRMFQWCLRGNPQAAHRRRQTAGSGIGKGTEAGGMPAISRPGISSRARGIRRLWEKSGAVQTPIGTFCQALLGPHVPFEFVVNRNLNRKIG